VIDEHLGPCIRDDGKRWNGRPIAAHAGIAALARVASTCNGRASCVIHGIGDFVQPQQGLDGTDDLSLRAHRPGHRPAQTAATAPGAACRPPPFLVVPHEIEVAGSGHGAPCTGSPARAKIRRTLATSSRKGQPRRRQILRPYRAGRHASPCSHPPKPGPFRWRGRKFGPDSTGHGRPPCLLLFVGRDHFRLVAAAAKDGIGECLRLSARGDPGSLSSHIEKGRSRTQPDLDHFGPVPPRVRAWAGCSGYGVGGAPASAARESADHVLAARNGCAGLGADRGIDLRQAASSAPWMKGTPR